MLLTHLKALCLHAAILLLSVAPWNEAFAHDGHDHGAPPTPVSITIAPRIDASSTSFELIGVFRDGKLIVFLDRFSTNETVTNAVIEVETPTGSVKASANADGTYSLDAPWAAKGGKHDLIFTVTAGTDLDILTGTLTIPVLETIASVIGNTPSVFGMAVARGLRDRVAAHDPTLPVAIVIAFAAGLLFARRRRSQAVMGIMIGGALVIMATLPQGARADSAPIIKPVQASVDLAQRFPDDTVFVPKATQRILAIRTQMTGSEEHRRSVTLPGRIIPDPNGIAYVQASVAGRLAAPDGGFARLGARVATGDVLALVQPALGSADATTQQQQARELDQQLALVRRRLERLRAIANVVARAQIEDAELELEGLLKRRSNLDQVLRIREQLVAPMPGVIAAASAVAGQIAEPNAVIFQIVDPARFWVEALSNQAQGITEHAAASLSDGRTITLSYRGTGLVDRNQSLPVQFEVTGGAKDIRLGQLVMVLAKTDQVQTGIAVPRSSVLRGANGQAIVYEHANAERFVPREVRVEPLDGDRVLIIAGIETARRIVTQGAELLNQIR